MFLLESLRAQFKNKIFKAYGISVTDTDPREKTLNLLLKKVDSLEKKLKTLEKIKHKLATKRKLSLFLNLKNEALTRE